MKSNYDLSKLKKRPGKVKVIADANKISVTLRVDANDLSDLKSEASRLGVPYQTLIGSLVHRYVNGELLDKRDIGLLKLG